MSIFRRIASQSALLSCALLAAAGRAAAAQGLDNASFDANGGTPASWVAFNNVSNNVATTSVTARTGTQSLKVFGGYNGAANYSGAFQSLPATAGQAWVASIYVRHNSGDAVSGANRLVLKIEFYNTVDGEYGTAEMISEHEILALDSASQTNTWLERSLTVTAPAGTVEVRAALVYSQFNNAGGAALIEDVGLGALDPIGDEWQLVWGDEFDGSAIDPAKWRVEDLHLIKNAEIQYYAPDDAYLSGGKLLLRSQRRSYSGYDSNGNWGTWNYTSGLVESIDRFATAYGRIEVRAKLPSTRGIWPAHWTLPASGFWPPEIDIMELLGHEPTRVYMSQHQGTWPNVISESEGFAGPNFAADFHTFAVEWDPDVIRWYVDDVLRAVNTLPPPREPFYVILNTAVGGLWPGNPDASTIFPQYHEIDYVRIYMPSDPGTPAAEAADAGGGVPTTNGAIVANEYTAGFSGRNAGLFNILGNASTLYMDSSADGTLYLGLDSQTALPDIGGYAIVVYLDTTPDGLPSTYTLDDTTDRARRAASAKTASARSDLFFAPGFLADFALVLEPGQVSLFDLADEQLTLINGATSGAGIDFLGGLDVRYYQNASDAGQRELSIRLADVGVPSGGAVHFVATLLNADTGFRANEFVGIAAGNPWDSVNPGIASTVLKPGDYARFTTGIVSICGPSCGTADGEADFDADCDVDLSDLGVLLASYGQSGLAHQDGDADFDGDADLSDLGICLSVFGAACP